MNQSETKQWNHSEEEESQFEVLHSKMGSLQADMLNIGLQENQEKQSRKDCNLSLVENNCVPLLLIRELSKSKIRLSENNLYLNQTQRNRYAVEQNARRLLIQQSQSGHKIPLSHQYLLKNQTRIYDDAKIQGFALDQFSQETSLERKKTQIKHSHQSSFKLNQQKALEIIRSKRRSLLIPNEKTDTPQQQSKKEKQKDKKCDSTRIINKIMYKLSFLKNMNPVFDNSDHLNKKFLLLQERMLKKRFNSQTIAQRRKQSTNTTSNVNERNLALYTRQLIYSTKKSHNRTQSPQNIHKYRFQHQKLNSNSQIFQPMNPQLQSRTKRDTSLKRQPSSVNVKTRKANHQQAILNILKNLKENKMKEFCTQRAKGVINYGKLQKNSKSLHNVHETTSRQQAALKFQWNKQKSKKRTESIKSETVDIFKLSLMAEQNRKTISVIEKVLNQKEAKTTNRFQSEPSQSPYKIISPIFLTSK